MLQAPRFAEVVNLSEMLGRLPRSLFRSLLEGPPCGASGGSMEFRFDRRLLEVLELLWGRNYRRPPRPDLSSCKLPCSGQEASGQAVMRRKSFFAASGQDLYHTRNSRCSQAWNPDNYRTQGKRPQDSRCCICTILGTVSDRKLGIQKCKPAA